MIKSNETNYISSNFKHQKPCIAVAFLKHAHGRERVENTKTRGEELEIGCHLRTKHKQINAESQARTILEKAHASDKRKRHFSFPPVLRSLSVGVFREQKVCRQRQVVKESSPQDGIAPYGFQK
jgi:hypothetical protein